MSQDEYDRLLGTLDAIQHAIIEIASELPEKARLSVASEIDMYGSRALKASPPSSRQDGQRDTAWRLAKEIWPESKPE